MEGAIGTDPTNPDTDGDTVSDGREYLVLLTDPLKKDTDRDALHDGVEGGMTPTDPTDPDTDLGGVGDGNEEIVDGTRPDESPDDDVGRFDRVESLSSARSVLLFHLPRVVLGLREFFPLARSTDQGTRRAWQLALERTDGLLHETTKLLDKADYARLRGGLTELREAHFRLLFDTLARNSYIVDAVRDRVFLALAELSRFVAAFLAPNRCRTHVEYVHTLSFDHRANKEIPALGRGVTTKSHIVGDETGGTVVEPQSEFRPRAWLNSDLGVNHIPRNAAVLLVWWTSGRVKDEGPGRRRIHVRLHEVTSWPGVAINAGEARFDSEDRIPDLSAESILNNVDIEIRDGRVTKVEDQLWWEAIGEPRVDDTRGQREVVQELVSTPVAPGLGTYEDPNTLKLRLSSFDWGGSGRVEATASGHGARACHPAAVQIPPDEDLDLLPDFYEREALGEAPAAAASDRYRKDGVGRLLLRREADERAGPLREETVEFGPSSPSNAQSLLPGIPDSLVDADPVPVAMPVALRELRGSPPWGVLGDGLGTFEEYRGAYEILDARNPGARLDSASDLYAFTRAAEHTRLDPWMKEMFLESLTFESRLARTIVNRAMSIGRLREIFPQRIVHVEAHGVYPLAHEVAAGIPGGRLDRVINYNRGSIEGFLIAFRGFAGFSYAQHAAYRPLGDFSERPDPTPWQRTVKVDLAAPSDVGLTDNDIGTTWKEPWAHDRMRQAHLGYGEVLQPSPNEAGWCRVAASRVQLYRNGMLDRAQKNPLIIFKDGETTEGEKQGGEDAGTEGRARRVAGLSGISREDFNERVEWAYKSLETLGLQRYWNVLEGDAGLELMLRLLVVHEMGHAVSLDEYSVDDMHPNSSTLLGMDNEASSRTFREFRQGLGIDNFDRHRYLLGYSIMHGRGLGGSDLADFLFFGELLDRLKHLSSITDGSRSTIRRLFGGAATDDQIVWSPGRIQGENDLRGGAFNGIDILGMRLHYKHRTSIHDLTTRR